jgi:hypothetical protein
MINKSIQQYGVMFLISLTLNKSNNSIKEQYAALETYKRQG